MLTAQPKIEQEKWIFSTYIPKREGEKNIFNIQTQKETVENNIFHTEIFNIPPPRPPIHVEQDRKPSAHEYKNSNQICIRKEYKYIEKFNCFCIFQPQYRRLNHLTYNIIPNRICICDKIIQILSESNVGKRKY